ncbi:hypothetical protein N665_0415s0008 [Sinapis alba]|nr:hypothetical protein N665_0415s0008 [Sinapis alba]
MPLRSRVWRKECGIGFEGIRRVCNERRLRSEVRDRSNIKAVKTKECESKLYLQQLRRSLSERALPFAMLTHECTTSYQELR